jgi:sulfur carrier protein ThiS
MFNRKTITVTVKPYGIVAKSVTEGEYRIPEGSKLRKVLRKSGAFGAGVPIISMIKGEKVLPGRRLEDGDEIKLLHVVGGG